VPTTRTRRGLAAGLALGALAAAAPGTAAAAATVTVTGDTGSPVAVPAGAPPTIRNMAPELKVAFPPGEGKYKLSVTAPNGAAASTGRHLLLPHHAAHRLHHLPRQRRLHRRR
jgi:hypothetical protein